MSRATFIRRFGGTLASAVGTARRNLIDFALPPICAGCSEDIERSGDVPLCSKCLRIFATPPGPICSRCAAPAPQPAIRETGCLHCEQTSFRFHHIAALGVYQGELQSLVGKRTPAPFRTAFVGRREVTVLGGRRGGGGRR